MKKLLAAIALAVGFLSTPAMAEVSIKEAVAILQDSVVPLKSGTQRFCTAFKVGPKQFLTADHCTRNFSDNVKVEHKYVYQFISTVTKPIVKRDKDTKFDWASFTTTTENTNLSALQLGCNEEIYIGMPVASMGFPATLGRGGLSPAFVTGYVSSVSSPISQHHNSDVAVDMPGAPGASGSPVLSLDTGLVIGVFIELVTGSRDGGIMMGFQSLKNTFVCEKQPVIKSEANSPKRKYNKEDAIYSPF
jgi:V8-like Glu-specific endopeptidase